MCKIYQIQYTGCAARLPRAGQSACITIQRPQAREFLTNDGLQLCSHADKIKERCCDQTTTETFDFLEAYCSDECEEAAEGAQIAPSGKDRWAYRDNRGNEHRDGNLRTDRVRIYVLYKKLVAHVDAIAHALSVTLSFPITDFLPATITATFLSSATAEDEIVRLRNMTFDEQCKVLQRLMLDSGKEGQSLPTTSVNSYMRNGIRSLSNDQQWIDLSHQFPTVEELAVKKSVLPGCIQPDQKAVREILPVLIARQRQWKHQSGPAYNAIVKEHTDYYEALNNVLSSMVKGMKDPDTFLKAELEGLLRRSEEPRSRQTLVEYDPPDAGGGLYLYPIERAPDRDEEEAWATQSPQGGGGLYSYSIEGALDRDEDEAWATQSPQGSGGPHSYIIESTPGRDERTWSTQSPQGSGGGHPGSSGDQDFRKQRNDALVAGWKSRSGSPMTNPNTIAPARSSAHPLQPREQSTPDPNYPPAAGEAANSSVVPSDSKQLPQSGKSSKSKLPANSDGQANPGPAASQTTVHSEPKRPRRQDTGSSDNSTKPAKKVPKDKKHQGK